MLFIPSSEPEIQFRQGAANTFSFGGHSAGFFLKRAANNVFTNPFGIKLLLQTVCLVSSVMSSNCFAAELQNLWQMFKLPLTFWVNFCFSRDSLFKLDLI